MKTTLEYDENFDKRKSNQAEKATVTTKEMIYTSLSDITILIESII